MEDKWGQMGQDMPKYWDDRKIVVMGGTCGKGEGIMEVSRGGWEDNSAIGFPPIRAFVGGGQ